MLKTIDISKVNEYKFALVETEKGTMKLELFGD
ncbi:peptidylprolyl isomerase, partial [Campylobacter coli]|nr:peptidylprolyl isomerase [Campylobacter coli]